jgi:hypothetical protein
MLEVGTVAHEYKPYSSQKITKGEVVDNLLSNRADLPLSANQGRVLNEKFIVGNSTDTLTVNIPAGGTAVIYPSHVHSGYTRIGVIGFNFSNNNIIPLRFDETSFTLYNRGSSTITQLNASITCLYMKGN